MGDTLPCPARGSRASPTATAIRWASESFFFRFLTPGAVIWSPPLSLSPPVMHEGGSNDKSARVSRSPSHGGKYPRKPTHLQRTRTCGKRSTNV